MSDTTTILGTVRFFRATRRRAVCDICASLVSLDKFYLYVHARWHANNKESSVQALLRESSRSFNDVTVYADHCISTGWVTSSFGPR